jgi:prepilin-type N-terminal cleavage/methylation domain-containing protein
MYMQWAKKQTGFTIVELLIVIVVIAILAAITIIAYNGIQQRARITQQTAAVAQYAKAYSLYVNEKGTSPYTNNSNPTNMVACVFPYPDCNDAGRNVALGTELAANIAPYLRASPKYNAKIAVNYANLTPSFTGIYLYVIFDAPNIDCPSIGSLNTINKTALGDGTTACRYAPV